MSVTQLHTAFPQTDVRIPPFAPALGAMSLPRVQHAGEVSGEPNRGTAGGMMVMGMGADPLEPLPESLLGLTTAGMSGALTGGIAASSWYGAGIGAAVNVGLWSLFNLIGAWRTTGPKTKVVMGLGALLGTSTAVGLFLGRKK